MSKLKKWQVREAIQELVIEQEEFTQFELHKKIEELLGRELSTGEKARATKIAKAQLGIKDVKYRPDKIKVYIFIF